MVSITIAVVLAFAVAVGVSGASQSSPPGAGANVGRFPVRVLVLTMFDNEIKPWLASESLPITIPVTGGYAPLHCASNGLCVTLIGRGKANAATSVSAILNEPRVDLGRAYFLTAGIAGTPPDSGTLGFAAWARWVVDWDLGHHLLPGSDPDAPHGYLPYDVGTNVYRLDDHLVDTAYRVTKDLHLVDSADAIAARSHYGGQASQHPYVTVCDTITGDDYWAGAELSQTAHYITDLRTNNQGRYCTGQMEDNAIVTVLSRYGYLNRYLSLRTASDFDQPYPGQNMKELLSTFPGIQPAVFNAYLVGSTMAHYLLQPH